MNVVAAVRQMNKMLGNLDRWIEAAERHAEKKGFHSEVLLGLRLVADQYPFVRQVQSCCDTAKSVTARLAGKEVPVHPDDEKTLEELRDRIAKTRAFLSSFEPSDFDGCETRQIRVPYIEGRWLTGADYLCEMATPNFYFHVTTAYAILRQNGVELGKLDYIGSLTTLPD